MFHIQLAVNFLVGLWYLGMVITVLRHWDSKPSEMMQGVVDQAKAASDPKLFAAIHMAVTIPLIFGLTAYTVFVAIGLLPKTLLVLFLVLVGTEILLNFDRIGQSQRAISELDATLVDVQPNTWTLRRPIGIATDLSAAAVMFTSIAAFTP